jgi:hypothetical protein
MIFVLTVAAHGKLIMRRENLATLNINQSNSETIPLIRRQVTARNKRRLFFKKLVNLISSSIDAAGAADANWDQYMRALRHCMITDFACSSILEIETSYIALAAVSINFSLRIAANHFKARHRLTVKKLTSLWNFLIDAAEMNYFYLGFAMFIHTIALSGYNSETYNDKIKVSSEIFGWLEVALSIVTAIFSNTHARRKLKECIIGDAPRGITTKIFDAFFELLRGFAIMRSLIFGIQEIIYAHKLKLNIFLSPISMTSRYLPSGLFGTYLAYKSWQRPPHIEDHYLVGTGYPWPHLIPYYLTVLYFFLFTGLTLFETPAPHNYIIMAIYSALLLMMAGYAYFSTKSIIPNNNSLITQEENIHPSSENTVNISASNLENVITLAPEQLTTASTNSIIRDRDKTSGQILTAGNSSYKFAFNQSSDKQNEIKVQDDNQLKIHTTINKQPAISMIP